MKMKVVKEWFIEFEWGKVALISWGNQQGQPVLLVHGHQDSAATFLPLLELLPDDHYYVSFDMPGHGKSDTLPPGITICTLFGIVVIDKIVEQLKWTKFIYIGHSLGAGQGLFYNAIYPGNITKMILLDSDPSFYFWIQDDFPKIFSAYEDFYKNYTKYNNSNHRVYTKSGALQAVMKSRGMTEQQAEVILSRTLKKIGDDQYKLLLDERLKNLPSMYISVDYFYKLFSKNSPPTLYINAIPNVYNNYAKDLTRELISKLLKNVKNFEGLTVDGTHDVHYIHPERISDHVRRFIKRNEVISKL